MLKSESNQVNWGHYETHNHACDKRSDEYVDRLIYGFLLLIFGHLNACPRFIKEVEMINFSKHVCIIFYTKKETLNACVV